MRLLLESLLRPIRVGSAALALLAFELVWGCTAGVDDECAPQCASQGEECQAIYGNTWDDTNACYHRNQLAACATPTFEPDVVFVSVAPDDTCWTFAQGHPPGWSVDVSEPYACPPRFEPGDIACE